MSETKMAPAKPKPPAKPADENPTPVAAAPDYIRVGTAQGFIGDKPT